MAKLTLIEIVQDIANDLDTDNVNSISDTVESVQIAQIVKTSYFELMASRNWAHLKRTVQMSSVSDPDRPTHLQLPEGTKEVIAFSYNKITAEDPTRDRFSLIEYVEPEEFLKDVSFRNMNLAEITKVVDFGGAPIYIYNDRQPSKYTSFDDEYIVLDSYNSALETTVQNSNTQSLIYFDPIWSHIDSAIPDMPSEAFPLLVEEAKSTASVVLRQVSNAKAEQKAQRQNRWLSRKDWRVKGGVRYPNYGRK
jgi:hypothetical protein